MLKYYENDIEFHLMVNVYYTVTAIKE